MMPGNGMMPGYGMPMMMNEQDATSAFAPRAKHKRLNLLAVCINMFIPWMLFTFIFFIMSFEPHYWSPTTVYTIVFLSFVFPLVSAVLTYVHYLRDRDPMWFTFSTISLIGAIIIATVCGDYNFNVNMQTYFDMEYMNTYPSVNPAHGQGPLFADAGRVYFTDGSAIDQKKTMGFRNLDTYCVAPITNAKHKQYTYDFWAVGVNCCGGEGGQFRCGEFNNPNARSGLRLMRNDQLPYFRLAVQQAEAAYNLKATHPLFFYWLQDPVHEMDHDYRDKGYHTFLMLVFAYFVFNVFCVLSATVAFSKLGAYR